WSNGRRTTASLMLQREPKSSRHCRTIRGILRNSEPKEPYLRLSYYRIFSSIIVVTAFLDNVPAVRAKSDDAAVKLNPIQVIGTHNSYHAGIAPSESKIWQAKYADAYKGLDYQHQPLPQQFDSGVRQIELDVYADSKGGLYAHPSGPSMVAAANLPPDPD